MLVIRPDEVRFDGLVWTDVVALAVQRRGQRVVTAFNDLGPHPTFVDVPERTTTVRVVRRVSSAELDAPLLGRQGVLTFSVTRTAGQAARRTLTATCVVTDVAYDLAGVEGGGASGGAYAKQTVTLVALAAAGTGGAGEPIAVSE